MDSFLLGGDTLKHIRVFDLNMNLVAILQNAFKIGYVKEINNLWTCSFSLPLDDPKRIEVTARRFLELWDHNKYIGKFIVNPKKTVKNESDRSITYNCEHVWSTLHSDVLFRYHQFTNYTTEQVLSMLIDMQETPHWRLGTVEFTKYFSYSWENEDSLLNAVVSVPKSFSESYLWTWDDTVYPFILNLVSPEDEKVDVIRHGKNMKGIEKDEDPTGLITRIYPLGNGEGVNQLGIESANNGIPYLEAEQSIIDQYGVIKKIWPDSRFEDAASLKASAQSLLDKYKVPLTTVSVDCIDYELIDPYKLVKYDVAKVVGVFDEDTDTNIDLRIMKLEKPDVYGDPSNIKFDLGNVREDLGMTIADLQKKQLVNDTYSQGATNIDSRDFQDNCDSTHPAVIRFPIPDDVVNINSMTLTFETQKFRAFDRAIKGGGATVSSTSSGGGVSTSTSSGGGTTQSSSSGGGANVSSSNVDIGGITLETGTPAGSLTPPYEYHTHYVTLVDSQFSHSHSVSVPNHAHSVSIPNHTHDVSIPNHSHSITLPDHTHDIEFGIFELNETPSQVVIEIDGTAIPFNQTSGENIDLVPYLSKDSNGKIQRGRYAEIKITPNSLARINATVTSRLFIQSRIGGTY
jgi:phage minor structural protein